MLHINHVNTKIMGNISKLLRIQALPVVLMFLLTLQVYAQKTTLFSESFETGSGATPPAGWVVEQVTGAVPGITFVNSSVNPVVATAYNGARFVSYNSHDITTGSTRLKRTAAVNTTGHAFILVDFAWYEDPAFPAAGDKVEVQWSTNGTTWLTAGTFPRYNAAAGWKLKHLELPQAANNQPSVYIAFLFTAQAGNNCSLDMVKVSEGPAALPLLATIGNGTTVVGWPYYTFYMGSRSQMLYTAAQLSAAGATSGNISSVGFDVVSASTQLMTNFTIKMGATASTALTTWVTTGMNTVYQVNYSVPAAGWQDITLTTPFVWNGTSNVVVEICFGDNISYTSNSTVKGTAATSTTLHVHADNYAGCTGAAAGILQTATPNIRFSVAGNMGMLTGIVRDSSTLLPVAGAVVSAGTKMDTTAADGSYTLYNLIPGVNSVTCSASGYTSVARIAYITAWTATTLDIALLPCPRVGGTVTDASTGLPLIGATVTVGGIYQTMSVAGGSYLTPLIPMIGTQNILFGKTGYEDFITTVTLVSNSTVTVNAALIPTAVPPGPVSAVLNFPPPAATAVNLSWIAPRGSYQLIYDDGIQDNFALWTASGNLNALKFTPTGYPAQICGGKVHLGTSANYPSNALPLQSFMMYAMKADGASGTPGTILDSVVVTPAGFGFADFSFAVPITINSGDFYLAMAQGGVAPNAAGLAVDMTTASLRSYSKSVSTGGSWISATGTFMIRAVMKGSGGPMLTDSPGTGTGGELTDNQSAAQISYQVWRLQQGQEGNTALWTSIYTGTATSTIDIGWPALPDGPYRWAVKAIYSPPGQRFSSPTFSNVIGKNWTAPVTVCATLSCQAFSPAGTTVRLVNQDYPDTVYTGVTGTGGCATIPNVWKGNYQLGVYRTMYTTLFQNISVTGPNSVNVNLTQALRPVTELKVADTTLIATWKSPQVKDYILNEDFSSGNFTANQWVVSGGTNWQINTAYGNPPPTALFNWTPQQTNYNQYLTSKSLAGNHSTRMQLRYDIYLDNYGTTYQNQLAVEIWDGTAWSTKRTYDNSYGSFPWTTEVMDISSLSDNPAFNIRFHASGTDSRDLNFWEIDNVMVYSADTVAGNNPCIIGYNFYLNNVQLANVQETHYTIPPSNVVYGQIYTACVEAVYSSGTSPQACANFTSFFLYPPLNLAVNTLLNTANITWSAPSVPAGLSGYNVFRDGKKINTTLLPGLSFTDEGVPNGWHSWIVKAVYGTLSSLPAGPYYALISGVPTAPLTMAGIITAIDTTAISVPVTVNNFTGITALSLRLDYDPTVMTYTGFTPGTPVLSGLTVNNFAVSPTLSRIMIFWSGAAPQTIPAGGTMTNLLFNYKTGTSALTWNNDSGGGTDCEFADVSGEAMLDNPTYSYYMDGQVTGIPVQVSVTDITVGNGENLCVNAKQLITVAGNGTTFDVYSGGMATFAAGQKISMFTGTKIHAGGYLHAYIATNRNFCGFSPSTGPGFDNPGQTSVPEITGNLKFSIFPNPASDRVTLQFSSAIQNGSGIVSIYNLLGKEVLHMVVVMKESLTVSLKDLPEGLYIVRVVQGFGSGSGKIIVNVK